MRFRFAYRDVKGSASRGRELPAAGPAMEGEDGATSRGFVTNVTDGAKARPVF